MDRTLARRSVFFLGHITFLALCILAWKHAGLRTTSGDTAFQIFKWVNNPDWTVEAHRYTAILPQAAVKFFRLFNAPLSVLLLVASLAHVLVGYAVFLICLLWLKAPRSAVATALAAVLCTRLTFYGPVLEANYLLCYPFLFFGLLERFGRATVSIVGGVGFVVAGAITLLVHPLGWLILLFGVVYLWSLGQLGSKVAVVLSAALFAGAGLVRWIFPPTVYEQAQYAHLQDSLSSLDLGTKWDSWNFLVGHTFTLTTNYLPALFVFLLVSAVLMARKQWKSAVVLVCGVVGFLALALVTFRSGDTAIMMDRAFLPIATLIAVPSVYLLWELRNRWAVVGFVLFVLVLFIKLRDISFASRPAQEQFTRIEQLLDRIRTDDIRKAEVNGEDMQARSIDVNWSLPYSTLLISSMDGPSHSIALRMGPSSRASTEDPTLPGMTLGLEQTIQKMDPKYFTLPQVPYVHFPIAHDVP